MKDDANCAGCNVALTFMTKPNFGTGKLNDGGKVCRKCFARMAKIDVGFGLNSSKLYSTEDVKRALADSTAKTTADVTPVSANLEKANDAPLSKIEELKLRKYLAEAGNMSNDEAEKYFQGLSDTEKLEIIQEFRSETGAAKAVHTESIIREVQVVKESDENQIKCPKCNSTNVTFDKQGFGVGKAAVGALLTGGIGLLAGGIGKNKILITCLKCGKQWKAGKA